MPGMHSELKLVRGIQVAPGDTSSAEQGYAVVDLLSGSAEGIALNAALDGWNPALPAPKPGLWADIPFADGRTPVASAEMNVTETLRLIASAPTHLRMSEILSELYNLVEDCDRFWNDEFYNQPVFLHWWALGAPGRQYALIMAIDVDVSNPTVEENGTILRDIVLTIEREPYWRAEVPPGANPIYWTLFAQGKLPGLNYDYLADLRLTGSPSLPVQYALAQDTLENFVDYTTLSFTVNTIDAQNGLFIPAASIPGDAPALMQITLRQSSAANTQNFTFLIARSTKTRLETMRDGNIVRFVTMIPFTAGNYLGPSAVLAADTGGIGDYNVTTSTTIAASRVEVTPAGATLTSYWSAAIGLSKNTNRGRFAIFVRCRQHNGASGDLTLRVRFTYGFAGVSFSVVTRTVNPVLQTGAGATATWPLLYVDTIRLPADREVTMSTYGPEGGSGKYNATRDNITVALEVARSTGTGVLYFADVILMPYDEALIDTAMVAPVPSGTEFVDTILVDNTGYLTRGKPGQAAIALNTTVNPTLDRDFYQPAVECRGVPMTLRPAVENAIYIVQKNDSAGSAMNTGIEASVNIVPRWRGIRTV